MNALYEDIKALTDRKPDWYDEAGVPRYAPFEPAMAHDIYCDEIALVRIRCQACLQEFLVAISWGLMQKVQWAESDKPFPTLAEQIAKGGVYQDGIHYGDPPAHGCTGDSMNCEDLEVVEYWERFGMLKGWRRDFAKARLLPGFPEDDGT